MEAELFDGTVLEFPDGTSQDVIQRVVKEQTAQKKSAAPAVAPAPEAPSTLGDMAASFGSGIVRGTAELGMLPLTGSRMLDKGVNFVANQGDDLIRSIMGSEPRTYDYNDPIKGNGFDAAQDAVRGVMDNNLYAPRTMPGEFAETVGEFVAPGGLPSRSVRAAPGIARKAGEYAADFVRNAVTPGVASEAAGQVTEGTSYEAPARLVGALAGNVASAGLRASSAPETVLRRTVGDRDAIDWDRAIALQNNSTGVRLTGPEAITQAQNGASALPNLQRVIEGSIEGRAATAPFFAARPGQVDTAVGNFLDQIAPQSPNPSMLGPRAAEAATSVIDETRQGINARTRPLYQAAEPQTVPTADFAAVQADPRFATALARLRANPELGPDYAAMPDNSVAVIDAVTKDMNARGVAQGNSSNALYGPEAGAANARGAADARATARTASPEYDQALVQQEALRRAELDPLQQGPVGRVAAATDTPGAGGAILPQNPLVGSGNETMDAVMRMSAQDPDTTAALIRQTLADRYAKAATETQEGVSEFAGAKYNKDVAGNPQRRETLDAALRGLPTQDAATALPELLDVLAATGRRKQIGSATAFNNSLNQDLGTGSMFGRSLNAARTLGASFLTNAGDMATRAAMRNSIGDLAGMFTDPNSVELIRAAMLRGGPTGLQEALVRTGLQGTTVGGK